MYLRTFFDPKLAHYAYLVGCQRTGKAIVIDPSRDLEPYLAAAQAEGLQIVAAAETHIHADFVSGCQALAERTGATLYLSAAGGREWRYHYASAYPHQLLKDGDCWQIGSLCFQALHTPGHTPEHMAYLLTDTATTTLPMGVFTGDFVFVGDVGRPDLLETVVNIRGAKLSAARTLFHAVQRFKQLPDHLQIWPAHGAGSACGKALGAVPTSTVGYERQVNWAFQVQDEATFIATILDGQPEAPRYFAMMKQVNQAGSPTTPAPTDKPPCLPVARLIERQASGCLIVDSRSPAEFAHGHLPGSINLPFADRSFVTYAGSFLEYTRAIYLIIDPAQIGAAVNDLARIGLEQVAGYFMPTALAEWSQLTGQPLSRLAEVTVGEVKAAIDQGTVALIDVRTPSEFAAGHLPGACNIPLTRILDCCEAIPTDRPVVLYCKGGFRSSIAAGLLASQGHSNVLNLQGGYGAWLAAPAAITHRSTGRTRTLPPKPRPAARLQTGQPAPVAPSRLATADLPYWMELPSH